MRLRGPHFVVPPSAIEGGQATLGGDDAHHLARALRAAPGDPVSVSDGVGRVYQGRVVEVGRTVVLALGEALEMPAPRPRVRVVQALAKGRKLDDVVRQLTELGVDEISPVTTTRAEPDPDDEAGQRQLERWRAVAHAAAKQSRRAWLPEITPIMAWPEAFDAEEPGVVCWEEAACGLRETVTTFGEPARVTIAIGPEGGLTADEVAACGLTAVTLGETVMRTETAGLVAAVAAMTLLGRVG